MNKKILIFDDDQEILNVTRLILEEEGYQVVTEISSLDFTETVLREKPDLLLVDLWMPVLPGDQLTAVIRSHHKLARLPIVIFSATIEGESRALSAGADAFVIKPFDIDELTDTISMCLKR